MSDNLTIPSPIGYRPPRRQRPGLTPEMKGRLIIAGGILGGLLVIGGAASLIGRGGGEVPVIQPDDRPIRVKPEDPGGLKIAAAETSLFGDGETSSDSRLAPAPEAPNPSALRAPPEPVRPTAPPTAATPAPQPGTRPQAGATTTPAPAPRTTTPPPATATAPKPPATAQAPAQSPAPPRAATPAQPTQAPAATPAPAAKPAGRVAVQLVAVSSEASAQAEWQALRLRHPDLFGSRQPSIVRAERDGKVFWRVRTGGFADLAEARSFCERVRAKGPACAVAEF